MKYLDLTFEDPARNLACDEALLELSENGDEDEILRVWEAKKYFVVLGYSGKVSSEVHVDSCRAHDIPILRRVSGGGTVLQGPGCLNFALILKIEKSKPLQNLVQSAQFVLSRHKAALKSLVDPELEIRGLSDLALGTLKFSGNAQRRKRRFLLFHGTFLLSLDFGLMEKLLPVPKRQPPYRENRPHTKFLTNLKIPQAQLKKAIQSSWEARLSFENLPLSRIDQLVKERYATPAWNFKF